MSTETYSSAEVLHAIWGLYVENYPSAKPTKSAISSQLGYNKHTLAKWMRVDGPANKRIPLEHIATLATGLRLSEYEINLLWRARIREMAKDDPSIGALTKWAVNTARANMRHRHGLDDDGLKLILAAYRDASVNYPRGLFLYEKEELVALFKDMLAKAERTHFEFDAQEDEAINANPESAAKLKAMRDKANAASRNVTQFRFRDALKKAKGMHGG